LAGSGAVGKTSLLKVLKGNIPLQSCDESLEYHRTLFLECEQLKTEQYQGIFQVYDIAGQLDLPIHAIRDTPRTVLGKVDLVLLIFANNNVQTLLDIQEWFQLIKEYYEKNNESYPSFILVNNKMDLDRTFDMELIETVKEQEDIKEYFEISCLNGEGISNLKKWLEESYFKTTEKREE
jgi:small GTP-binding protein